MDSMPLRSTEIMYKQYQQTTFTFVDFFDPLTSFFKSLLASALLHADGILHASPATMGSSADPAYVTGRL